jgi:hypothetical protein
MEDYTQTAFVTHDLERSIATWHAIGAGPFDILDLGPLFADRQRSPRFYKGKPSHDEFRIATGFLGKNQIELVQPTNDEPGVFGDWLRERGEGMHHIQTLVCPVDAALFDRTAAGYAAEGHEQIGTITQPNGHRVAFFDSVGRLGFILELVERHPKVFQMIVDQHQRHLERDKYPMIMK